MARLAPPTQLLGRDATLRALRALAKTLRRPVVATDLDARVRASVFRQFRGLAAARRAAGLPDAPSEPAWSRSRVLRELRKLHRAGLRITEAQLRAAGHGDIVGAANKHAGGIVRARALAKIPAPRPKWTRGGIIDALRLHVRAHGGGVHGALGSACKKLFGSIAEARQAAGVSPVQRTWSKHAIIAEIRRQLAAGDDRFDRTFQGVARHHFGSMNAAREAAGAPVLRRRWSRALVVRELRALGAAPLVQSSALWNACFRHFGSVAAARRAAGLPARRQTWSRERVLDELRRKGLPAPRALRDACKTRFGSLGAACLAAGIDPPRQQWSRQRVLDELRRPEDGAYHPSLWKACRRHFGSVAAARRAAGVQRPPPWSRNRLVREIRRLGARPLPTRLVKVALRLFGSTNAARRAAGVVVLRRRGK